MIVLVVFVLNIISNKIDLCVAYVPCFFLYSRLEYDYVYAIALLVFGFIGLVIILNKFDVAKNMLRSQLY